MGAMKKEEFINLAVEEIDNKTIRYGTETRTLHNITAEIIYNVDNVICITYI